MLAYAHHTVGLMKEEGLASRARWKLLLRASFCTVCWMRFGQFAASELSRASARSHSLRHSKGHALSQLTQKFHVD